MKYKSRIKNELGRKIKRKSLINDRTNLVFLTEKFDKDLLAIETLILFLPMLDVDHISMDG